MTIKVTIPPVEVQTKPRITVFGVGGAGGNAVNNMIRANLEGVEFVVANTDAQALQGSLATQRVQLGNTITRGLGAGSRPDVGRAAAEEQLEEILNHLSGTNMCFITAGMGGGTGTGAAPVIARAAREQGILTVGVVTKPFNFEGAHRMRIAEAGIQELAGYVDTLIIIPNQNLFRIANERTTFADAFKMADDVLHAGVRGVTDLMVMPGLINLDFADIRTVMTEMGKAMMGTGEASGERRAVEAAEAAISNPLLDDVSMKGARGVLINITGGLDMTLFEVDEAANRIRDEVDPEANIIFGSTFDESMEGKMRVSVVSTGIETVAAQQPRPAQPQLTVVHDRTAPGQKRPQPVSTPMREAPRPVVGNTAMAQNPVHFTNLTPAPVAPPVAGAEAAPMTSMAEPETAQVAEPMQASEMFPEARMAEPAPAARPAQSPAQTGPLRGERRENGFIAPQAAGVGPRVGATNPERFAPPAAEPKKKGFLGSLLGKMTGAGSETAAPTVRSAPQAPQPQTARQAPPQAAAPQQGLSVEPAPRAKPAAGEDDMLDIPAFLRRQAN